jgi:TPR repeat protein
LEDIAHDASGPASPTPSDIALQQASRPDSPDRGKLRVFISYSRDDLDFADQLDAALNACSFECIIDRHGIPGGEEWKRRLGIMISEADTVVFVLSPTSARSSTCTWEAEEAERLGKRILPVICRPLEGASPPPQLRERNYIYFYNDPKAAPGAGFGTGLAKLIAALNTDFDWLREHTRYLQRATEWDRGGRPANRLLSGDDIADAKDWVARRPKNAPEPTALHLDFIRASEEEAEARSSAQRKQLEAMDAAQAERETALHKAEEALKHAADAQRKRARIRNIAFVVVSIFAIVAGWLFLLAEQERRLAEEQRAVAEEQKAVAEEHRAVAEQQRQQADQILAGATDIIVNLKDQMNEENKKTALELFQMGAARGHATMMFNLGQFYAGAFGLTRDYGKAREWYERAADKGHASAMANLGILYHDGLGVAQDYGKASEWYEKAADKGHVFAMALLGDLYRDGLGVAQDYGKAREWYLRALSLRAAAGKGGARPCALRQAHSLVACRSARSAADKGPASAMASLGGLYFNGHGVAKDYLKALQWQEAYAAKVEALETKREGKPGKETAEAVYSVAWYALFAQEFAKALTAVDHVHTLFPDYLDYEVNRAHALMFLERGEDSKALYLAHKGKPLEADARLWQRAIAEDFAEFRKAGLTHPMMADIEKELGVSR